MAAFWGLFLLLGYGCIRPAGLVQTVRSWILSMGGRDLAAPWMESFPILGRLDLATVISVGVLALGGLLLYIWLNRPKVADMLIDTEGELRKVTWPTFADTWKGTLAVVFTVAFMLVYLTGADLAIHTVMRMIMLKG
jgi:preprotein translocase SecE subunit